MTHSDWKFQVYHNIVYILIINEDILSVFRALHL